MSELKAGRELNRLVAEKVMGLRVQFSNPHGRDWTVDKSRYVAPVPSYSEDIQAAMQVVEKMRQSQKWCCITIHSDHDYVWRVSFTRSPTEDSDTHEPAVSITGESLPECICLAALEAVESLEVKNETVTD